MAACLLDSSRHVEFGLVALQRGGEELMDVDGAIRGAAFNTKLKHSPIRDVAHNQQDNYCYCGSKNSLSVDFHGRKIPAATILYKRRPRYCWIAVSLPAGFWVTWPGPGS